MSQKDGKQSQSITCQLCTFINQAESQFCSVCGSSLYSASAAGQSKQETLQMGISKIQKQLDEVIQIKPLKSDNSACPQSVQAFKNIQEIEENIISLQNQMKQHRCLSVDTKCWYFGIEGLVSDYKEVWSSSNYWRMLISSSKQICTADMHFLATQNCCNCCQGGISELQQLKTAWQSLVKSQYDFL